LIAIVISYYKKKFFKRTLESLANQTDKRFNVYIGDDASSDNPKDLIMEYANRINLKYKRFENNLGGTSLVRQWDRCIELSADEKWIMILGDDDYLDPNVVESFYKHMTVFLSKTNVVRFAKQNIFDDQNAIAEIQYNPEWETAADSYYRRVTGQTTSTLSEYMFTRSVYKKHGFYDYPLAWQSDNRAWIEFSEDKPIYSINDAVVKVIRSAESITGSNKYKDEKRKANLSFYKYLIKEKLNIFNKTQSIRVLHKYENEIKLKREIKFTEYLFLFPYYLKNYDSRSFKNYSKKIAKSILNII